MALLHKYYKFIDKPTSEVTRAWKVCQIILYIIAACTGYASSYILGILKEEFGDNCILFPHIEFQPMNISDYPENGADLPRNASRKIDEGKTIWGQDEDCDFCQYVPVMSMIVGTIFITFFIMCPRGGSRESQSGIKRPWHIVLPSVMITGIFAFVILAASIKLQQGMEAFCGEFNREQNVTTVCGSNIEKFALRPSRFHTPTYFRIRLLCTLMFICVCAWFLAFLLLLLRCCCAPDFKIMEITISSVEEEVRTLNMEETEVLLEEGKQQNLPVSHV